MSELRDRLEALAARGTRRGADAVLSAARRDAETTSSDDTTDLDGTDLQIIDDDLPVVALEPGSRRRRRFGSIVASAGIAALIGVGALAVTAMFGSGGAGSPEAAVRQRIGPDVGVAGRLDFGEAGVGEDAADEDPGFAHGGLLAGLDVRFAAAAVRSNRGAGI